MYALIAWTSKNGVALGREELEVRLTTKLTVMNGGKMEPGTTVNMLFRKEIWGGIIQSLHNEKKDADEQLEKEVTPGDVSNVEEVSGTAGNQSTGKKSQRKRKKKSYGKDFKENDDTGESDNSEENDSSTCSPVLKETNGLGNKAKCKKVSSNLGEKENGKKRKSSAQKERELNISSQHDELVITQILGGNPAEELLQAPEMAEELPVPLKVPLHPHFGGKQPKQHKPPKCISMICKEEKDEMKRQLAEIHNELERAKEELNTLKALQSSTTAIDSIKYGKVPRSVGVAKNWEEISNGVWCCPVKVKAAIRTSATRTSLALALFAIFYPKEEIKGRRLHDLDQDVIDAITDFSLIAKLTKEPVPQKNKDGEEKKPPSPVSRSGIKQALRMKCNSLISLQRRKGEETATRTTEN